MKKSILLILAIFSISFCVNATDNLKVFSYKLNNSFYNKDCKLDNYKLLDDNQILNQKIKSILESFGNMSISDFDMGECLSPENLNKNILVTHFWQKNTEKLNHKLDLFISYNFKDNQVLALIIDSEKKSYFIGDNLVELKEALKINPMYVNNFPGIDFESQLKFSDLKEKEDTTSTNVENVPDRLLASIKLRENMEKSEIGSQWHVYCKKDRFNGLKSCFMNSSDVMVTLINGYYGVYVGRNHFPRTASAIKIDNNVAIYGIEGDIKSPLKVIEQMKRGKIAYTRYKEWPYEYNKDNEVDLSGFTLKFNELVEKYKQL